VVVALVAVESLVGQQLPSGGEARYTSRAELEAWLARLGAAVQSPAYSEGLKARVRVQEGEARARLADGDFHLGDRILLVVQGETALTDTFTVGQGDSLVLPLVGPIPLRGVLHAELEGYLTAQLARRIREPRVEVRPMVRLGIEGAVTRPGFYSVPVGALLGDALMAAGGLGPTARAEQARMERGGRNTLTASAFRQAVSAGRTLDQLGVRAGDRIVVPERGGGAGEAEARLRVVTVLLSLPLTIFAVTQLFH